MSKDTSPIGGPLALIAGPTASGKSDVAVRLALALKERGREAVVINADSQQVYADLHVLSARPTEEDMRGIEHRLFGTWDGAVACSANDWAEAAKHEIAELHSRDAVPILCGGTGLYMRTLLEGIAPIPEIDPEVRFLVRNLSTYELRECISEEDPVAARRLDANDTQRMARALEVVRATGRPLHEWQQLKVGGIADLVDLYPLILLPDREWLYDRCDRRFERMMRAGAVGEVARLLQRNLDPGLPVMRAIGVPEIAGLLQMSGMSVYDPMPDGKLATRQYAKRQYTWFRNQPPREWPRMEDLNFNLEDVFEGLFQD